MTVAKENVPVTDDNIIYFSKEQPNIDKIDSSAVEVLCDIAGRHLDDVVILGSDKETGAIKMMTTQEDVPSVARVRSNERLIMEDRPGHA